MTKSPDTSRCEEVRELLWPLDGLRALSDDQVDARAHLDACPDCHAFFARDAALGAALEGVSVGGAAPTGLRDRVLSAIEQDAATPLKPSRRRMLAWAAPLAAAAAVLVAALGLLQVGPQNLDALYVDSYLSRDAETTMISAPQGDQAYEFFMRELGVPVSPVLFGEGRINRAMICMIEGERTAMVEYELEGHMVAHYRGPITSEDGGGAMHSATEDGVCVVRWTEGNVQHALVADIPEDELRVIAIEQFAALP